MAQSFFPLSIIKPGGGVWPYFFKGFVPEHQDWLMYSGAKVVNGNPGFHYRYKANESEHNHLSVALGVDIDDCDILIRARQMRSQVSSNFTNTGLALFCRATPNDDGFGRPDSCYYVTTSTSSYGNLSIYRIVNGSQTSLDYKPTSAPDHVNRDVKIRFSVAGTELKARMWFAGEEEPTEWHVEATDANRVSGDIGLILHQYEMEACYYFIGIGTDGDPAPHSYPGGNRVVRGSVHLPDLQDGVGYTVRCYHRATGCLLGETVSNENGEFEFSLPISQGEPVYCMAIDQLGDSWNAPIADLVLPIAPD